MTNHKLLEYIEKHLKQGFSKKEIKNKLLKAGWKNEDIEAAFKKSVYKPKRSDNKRLFLLVIIIALIILIPLVILLITSDFFKVDQSQSSRDIIRLISDSYKSAYPGSCNIIQFDDYKSFCFYILATKTKNHDYCLMIPNSNIKSDCQWKIGVIKQDESVCGQIEQSSKKVSCIYELASSVNDKKVCESGVGTEGFSYDACIYASITETDDQLVCERMGDQSVRDLCYSRLAELKKEKDLCNLITNDNEKTICQIKTGKIVSDLLFCDSLPEGEIRTLCILEWAKVSRNPDICLKETNTIDRLNCLAELAILNNRQSICDKISVLKEDCILRYAPATGNMESCLSIPKNVDAILGNRGNCLISVAAAKQNEGDCSKLSGTRDKEYCLSGIVLGIGNPDMCSSIINEDIRHLCLSFSVNKVTDTQKCMIIPEQYKNICIEFSAFNLDDPGICLLIKDDKIAESCARNVLERMISR